MKVTIKPIESRDELRLATDLMVAVHSDGDIAVKRWLEDCSWRYPAYRPEHTRIAARKGEILGALRLTTDTVRIGEARLKMGGLGWVATSPRHRKHGIGRRLIDDTMLYMREHSYHVSMLFGIPNFYHRFGFTTTLVDYTILMETTEALTFENPYRSVLARPGEALAIQKMHNAGDLEATCSLVRTAAHIHNKWGRWNEWHLLKDDQQRIVGYFLLQHEGECLYVIEAGIVDNRNCAAIVRQAGVIAEEMGFPRIRFCLPPLHPLARFLTQFQTIHETRIDREGGGMMAIINLGETLESMIPEWERLLSKSIARDLRTEFTVVVDKEIHRVRATRGAIDIAAVSGTAKIGLSKIDLMHLITGYRYPADVLDERRCLISSDARTLFYTLFPKRHPHVWRFDRF